MKVHIIAVGERMPGWVSQGYQEYIKRLSSDMKVTLTEIPLKRRSKNSAIDALRADEGKRILKAIPSQSQVIALEVNGKNWSTEKLASHLKNWQLSGKTITLLIGGPDGLAPECRAAADELWSLSALTLPHPIVRIILAEQLYRAQTILKGHPYHRS